MSSMYNISELINWLEYKELDGLPLIKLIKNHNKRNCEILINNKYTGIKLLFIYYMQYLIAFQSNG